MVRASCQSKYQCCGGSLQSCPEKNIRFDCNWLSQKRFAYVQVTISAVMCYSKFDQEVNAFIKVLTEWWLPKSEYKREDQSVIHKSGRGRLCMVQFYLLPCPTPRAFPRGLATLLSLGGLFPTHGHAQRDNSPPPGLLVDHKYVVLCTRHRLRC